MILCMFHQSGRNLGPKMCLIPKSTSHSRTLFKCHPLLSSPWQPSFLAKGLRRVRVGAGAGVHRLHPLLSLYPIYFSSPLVTCTVFTATWEYYLFKALSWLWVAEKHPGKLHSPALCCCCCSLGHKQRCSSFTWGLWVCVWGGPY